MRAAGVGARQNDGGLMRNLVSVNAQPAARVFAIIPAAGRSRRMGRVKQLLEVGGQPMVLATIRPLLAAEIAGLVLVTRQTIAARLGPALPANVMVAFNEDDDSEMIDSVRIGVRAWRTREALRESDGMFVCPADQPGIRTDEFNLCIDAFRNTPDRIIAAARAGRRGHPLIWPVSLNDFVLSNACDDGLHALPRAFAQRVRLVPCDSPGVTEDMDTHADWQRWPKRQT